MTMYNFLEYSKTYEKATRTLWHFYRDEPEDGAVGNENEKNNYFVYRFKVI